MIRTKMKPKMGKNTETIAIKIELPASKVETTGLPNPAVETVDANLVVLVELFITVAVPPPAIIAKAQVITGLKSAIVDTITAVPASVAKGIAIVSSRLSI